MYSHIGHSKYVDGGHFLEINSRHYLSINFDLTNNTSMELKKKMSCFCIKCLVSQLKECEAEDWQCQQGSGEEGSGGLGMGVCPRDCLVGTQGHPQGSQVDQHLLKLLSHASLHEVERRESGRE